MGEGNLEWLVGGGGIKRSSFGNGTCFSAGGLFSNSSIRIVLF